MFVGQVYHNCPTCENCVWMASIFGFLKGSPYFNRIGYLIPIDMKR
jgi:hypothetical protein